MNLNRKNFLGFRCQVVAVLWFASQLGWPSVLQKHTRARLGLTSIEERQEQMTEQERKRRANIEQTS